MMMLSRTERFRYRPLLLRSSVRNAMPWRIASVGLPILTAFPRISTVPAWWGVTPNSDSMTSVRPAPIRPATPRISPSRREKLMSRKTPWRVSPCTSSAGGPSAAPSFWKNWSIARPTIILMSFSRVRFGVSSQPTSSPSR